MTPAPPVSKAVLFASADVHRGRETSPRSPRPLSSRLALLPVGNKPLVLHALEELIDAGISEVAVVTEPSLADEVHEVVEETVGERVATTHVVGEGRMFMDALRQVGSFVGVDSFVVHLGDSLTRGGLTGAIQGPPVHGNDALALVEENGSQVTPLGAGLASLRAAGIYVFGPGVLDLAGEKEAPKDWDLEIAGTAGRLAAAGGRIEVRPVHDWWRYRQRPDALLQANRFFLSGIRGGPTDAWLENTDLQGPVILHPSVRLTSSIVRGPVIIGPGAEIRDAYIGPYTSIGANVVIENAEVEHSIILPDASIRHLGGRLEASVVGRQARIFRDFRLPRAFRVNVGEGAEIALT
jgi:glucose-1-phosphate thymidylyltransferase